uniref:ARAD1D13794p n=1 Tax=Blastobotrys adeninivorans TaxID=409370 RepID=A0A060T9R0_BLAAD
MQAVRVHPAPKDSTPYSAANPAPSSALQVDQNVLVPVPSAPGELLVKVKATTVIRDMLTWPESYAHEYAILGNDFSGIVTEVFSGTSKFKPGDEVFGMADVDRASTWAEYTIAKEDEVVLKPASLTFAQAAAMPLSAHTAYEALFEHTSIARPSIEQVLSKSVSNKDINVLITGASGAVGIYLVQLAAVAGVRVVAASSSNARNEQFLRQLGADEVVEYSELDRYKGHFNFIIDTVGGPVLEKCWDYVRDNGTLVSVDSASYEFVDQHEKRGLRKAGVHAEFFIVKGSQDGLHYISELVTAGALQSFVAKEYPLAKVQEAYDIANGRSYGRGKVILDISAQ